MKAITFGKKYLGYACLIGLLSTACSPNETESDKRAPSPVDETADAKLTARLDVNESRPKDYQMLAYPGPFSEYKQTIEAAYIPLADHYPALVAYEKYGKKMKNAQFKLHRMNSWIELRALFMSGEIDMAFIICPMAMDMFLEDPHFRWVGLIHRDGNALAINELLNERVQLPTQRSLRKPDSKVAEAFSDAKAQNGQTVYCGVPAILSTHTVVLYKYLKDHGKTLGLEVGRDKDVIAIEIAPPKSPTFLHQENSRSNPASFEQSLPWADVVETKAYGHVAWYSKDVMQWPKGHVECIIIATDEAIEKKELAIKEVVYYIHRAGMDIEQAMDQGEKALLEIAGMIREHIPEHDKLSITQSLRRDLSVCKYHHLNVDKEGLAYIMDLALEADILREGIDVEVFADERFATLITNQ